VSASRFVYLHEERRPRGYEPIYRTFEPSLYVPEIGAHGFLNPVHERLPAEVEGIYGKLMPGDQHKLYEAAYFARGPILEIGRLHGKSAVILAMGMRDGAAARGGGHATARAHGGAYATEQTHGGGHETISAPAPEGDEDGRRTATTVPFYSVELQDKHTPIAEGHLRERGLLELVRFVQGDSAAAVADLPGPFDTIFVDGDHSYEGVVRDLDALDGRIASGGVAMFHDLFHPANATGEYGVARALGEHAARMGLAYRGRFGGLALYEQLGTGAAGERPGPAAGERPTAASEQPGGGAQPATRS
jgi:Methyltransferase domain